jgi:pyrroloquinoline quinone biosynthesis protein B
MRIKVLGSAAGGGFPQWNCSCRNCRLFREGSSHFHSRTQMQIAFSPDPDSSVWFLVGASPDLRAQINATPELAPRSEGTSPSARFSTRIDSVMGLSTSAIPDFFVFATRSATR